MGAPRNGGLCVAVRVGLVPGGELLREGPGRAGREWRIGGWQKHPFVALQFRFRARSRWKDGLLFGGLCMGGQLETLCGRYVLCEKLRAWCEQVPHEETRVQTRSPSISMFFSTHMSSLSGSSSVMWTELCALCLCFLLDSRWDDLCFFFVLCSPSLSLLRLLFDDRPSPMVRANVAFTKTGNPPNSHMTPPSLNERTAFVVPTPSIGTLTSATSFL